MLKIACLNEMFHILDSSVGGVLSVFLRGAHLKCVILLRKKFGQVQVKVELITEIYCLIHVF